jgi:hypothetical protein
MGSANAVERAVDGFFAAFLERRLARDELKELSAEFVAYYKEDGCQTACMRAAADLEGYTAVLRQKKGEPEALYLRHRFIEANYFLPQERLWLRLLTEPDPIRLADPGSKRVMTERDVVALANIVMFFSVDEPDSPRHQSLSAEKIDELAAELARQFPNSSGARALPKHYAWADELWAGIRREWSALGPEERQAVREYVRSDVGRTMPRHLYVRVLGMNEAEAAQVRRDDRFARMSYHLGRQLELTVQEAMADRILGIVHGR